jgi:hypothetical protein
LGGDGFGHGCGDPEAGAEGWGVDPGSGAGVVFGGDLAGVVDQGDRDRDGRGWQGRFGGGLDSRVGCGFGLVFRNLHSAPQTKRYVMAGEEHEVHLNSMLTGYRVALGIHDIAEPFDFWTPGSQSRFSEWLCQRQGRPSSLGWAAEIEREAERSGRPAMEMFFELLHEFRANAKPDRHPPTETQQAHVSD